LFSGLEAVPFRFSGKNATTTRSGLIGTIKNFRTLPNYLSPQEALLA